MKVYFITQKDMGEKVLLKPRKPQSAPDYEGEIPRICVSQSILGALSSIGRNLYLDCDTYVYSCDLDDSEIIQPSFAVNDVDYTGELWILIEKEFSLHKVIKLKSVNSFYVNKEKETEIYIYTFDIIKDKIQ